MQFKILDRKKGIIKIYLDSKEDAIELQKLLEVGDLIKAKSSRVIKQASGGKLVIQAVITLRVEKFYLEGSFLKVIGKIVESSSDEVPLNRYHSFMLGEGSEFTLIKQNPSESFYQLLEYLARKTSAKPILVASFDEDAAVVAEIRYNNLKIIAEFSGPGSIKRIQASEIYKYFEEIVKAILNLNASAVAFLVYPSLKKLFEEFLKEKYPELYRKSRIFEVTIGGVPGIREAIKAGYLRAISGQLRITKEVQEIENLFVEMLKHRTAAFGLEEVRQAIEYGAVKKLYVLEDLVNNQEIRKLIQDAISQGADVMFIARSHEAGQKLYYFGGIAALLRFPLE